ncbi:MAG: DUF2971 domain-containing protein [Paludibacteraceae bacterium]|nr:DUF2971 domain-containing protein [Paludibacteraceae bacterium]
MPKQDTKYWLHRISWEWQVSYPLLDRGFLSIGFCDFGTKESLEKLRNDFEGTIEAQWGSYGRNRFYLKNFVFRGKEDNRGMQKGDYVVVPKRGTFDIYEIVGEEVITSADILDTVKNKTNDAEIKTSDGKVVSLNNDGYLVADKKIIDLGFFWEVELKVSDIQRSKYAGNKLGSALRFLGTNFQLDEEASKLVGEILKAEEGKEIGKPKESKLELEINPGETVKYVEDYLTNIGAENIYKHDSDECHKSKVDVIASFSKIDSTIYVVVQKNDNNVKDWIRAEINEFKKHHSGGEDSALLWLISNERYFQQSIKNDAGIGLKVDSRMDFEEVYLNLLQSNETGDEDKIYESILKDILNKTKKAIPDSSTRLTGVEGVQYKLFRYNGKKGEDAIVYPIVFELQNIKYIRKYIQTYIGMNKTKYGIVAYGESFTLCDAKSNNIFTTSDIQQILDIIDNGKSVEELIKQQRVDAIKRILSSIDANIFDKECESFGNNHYRFKSQKNEDKFWKRLLNKQRIDGREIDSQQPNTKICRYTSLQSLFEILKNGTYRMQGLVGMNDISEVDYVDEYCGINSSIDQANEIFITSCSPLDKKDDLAMWRLYADEAKGVCLEFSIDKNINKHFIVHKIAYALDKGPDFRLDIIKRLIANGFVFNRMNVWKHFFKAPEYIMEDEVRVLFERTMNKKRQWIKTDKNSIINPAVDFEIKKGKYPLSLEKIILGPKCPEKGVNMKQIEILIKDKKWFQNFDKITVTTSSIDNYR